MKIIIRDMTMERPVNSFVGSEIDPAWRHTSKKGTVYRYDCEKKDFDPLPSEVREVHFDCDDPECGCDGWDETHYIDDAGNRFIPGTRSKPMHFPGIPVTLGWCHITEATHEEIESLIKPEDKGWCAGPPTQIRFDDPRVVCGFEKSPRGTFWFTSMDVEVDVGASGYHVIARGDFVANIEGWDNP